MSNKPERPDINQNHPLLDFPTGSGDPDCDKCKGRGVVPVMVDVGGGVKWPGGGTRDCDCVYKRDLIANVKRVWKVLMNVESVDESPLLGMTGQSLWITASSYDFRRHLRHVAFRKGPKWDARVVADATLVTAWLSGASEVFDADVLVERDGFQRDRPSEHYVTLVDLAVPFDLLIIRLGVKAAKNRETPNVIAEAINERELQGKPTWVVDSLIKPLAPGHICYSETVMEILDGFRRVHLSEDQPAARGAAGQYPAARRQQSAPEAAQGLAGGSASAYTRRKPGIARRPAQGRPVAPPVVDEDSPFEQLPMEDDGERTGPVPTPDPADDELDLDELLANAHDPGSTGVGLLPDDEFDPDELLEDFPTADELGGNAEKLPAFLRHPKGKKGGDE